MKSPSSFCALLSLLVLIGCSRPATESETASDSTTYEDDSLQYATSDEVDEPSSEPLNDVVDYYGSIDDSVEMVLASFEPLEKVLSTARSAIYFKDSIERVRETTDLTDPKDSALFLPKMREAYAAIMSYQAAMKNGIKSTDKCPKLTDIVRTPGESDKTSEYLPEAGDSKLSQGDFFFVGGAPFIMRESDPYPGPGGKPERHYSTLATENANYLFNSIYHQTGGAVDVTFGPPLDSYESGSQEVNGIGSLIHTFKQRIPVYFMTSNGPVDATLISATIKIVPEGMGCISDEPAYTFASFEDLGDYEILGIFIPYQNIPLGNMQVNYLDVGVWTADLDGDRVSDIACVKSIFSGISSDEMNEVLWFGNINGEWRIIDWGADPDCT
jgi:hypothetical protein